MSSRIIQHWKSKCGKWEMFVKHETPAIGVSYYVGTVFSYDKIEVDSFSRQTRVSIDRYVTKEVATALKHDVIYILQELPNVSENNQSSPPVVSREELSDYSGL